MSFLGVRAHLASIWHGYLMLVEHTFYPQSDKVNGAEMERQLSFILTALLIKKYYS